QPVPDSGGDAHRRAAAAVGGRQHERPLSAGTRRVLERQGRLRTCRRSGSDPMRPWVAVTAIAAASLAAGCTKVQGREAKAARPVTVQAVALASAPAAVRYSATIEAYQQVPLAFKTSG